MYKKIVMCLMICLLASQAFAGERYILKIGLKQSRVSLNPWDHAKDAMNATEFEIPVDRQFYDSVKVGDDFKNEWRTGSIILKGSFSKWKLWIEDKRIVKD